MSDKSTSKSSIKQRLLCSLSGKIMVEPLMARDGKFYDRLSLNEELTQKLSPLRLDLTTQNCINMSLRNHHFCKSFPDEVEEWKQRKGEFLWSQGDLMGSMEYDYIPAIIKVANNFHYGLEGFQKDIEKALSFYLKSEKLGSKDSFYEIACLYKLSFELDKYQLYLKKFVKLPVTLDRGKKRVASLELGTIYLSNPDVEPKEIVSLFENYFDGFIDTIKGSSLESVKIDVDMETFVKGFHYMCKQSFIGKVELRKTIRYYLEYILDYLESETSWTHPKSFFLDSKIQTNLSDEKKKDILSIIAYCYLIRAKIVLLNEPNLDNTVRYLTKSKLLGSKEATKLIKVIRTSMKNSLDTILLEQPDGESQLPIVSQEVVSSEQIETTNSKKRKIIQSCQLKKSGQEQWSMKFNSYKKAKIWAFPENNNNPQWQSKSSQELCKLGKKYESNQISQFTWEGYDWLVNWKQINIK